MARVAEARAYDDVLAARADRTTMVRDFLATVSDEVLDEERRNQHNRAHAETVRSCLHVIRAGQGRHRARGVVLRRIPAKTPPAVRRPRCYPNMVEVPVQAVGAQATKWRVCGSVENVSMGRQGDTFAAFLDVVASALARDITRTK